MYDKLYEQLEPRIGPEAAKLGARGEYTILFMLAVGLGVIFVCFGLHIKSEYVASTLVVLSLLSGTPFFYNRVQLAKAISVHLKTKVHWFEIPSFAPISNVDAWLGRVEARKVKADQGSKPPFIEFTLVLSDENARKQLKLFLVSGWAIAAVALSIGALSVVSLAFGARCMVLSWHKANNQTWAKVASILLVLVSAFELVRLYIPSV